MKLLPFVILLSVIFGACHDSRVQSVLDAADREIFQSPDSAVLMLDSLDVSGASEAQRARHALLLTKARHKVYIEVADDSLINIAAEYYRGCGDSREIQSLFYQGVVLRYIGNNTDALLALTKVADLAKDLGDDFYYGLANREQAGIYTDLYRFEQELKARQEAVKAFTRCGRPLHAAYARILIPQSLAHLGQTDQAYDSIKILERDSLIQSIPELYHELHCIGNSICYERAEYEEAERYFDEIISEGGEPDSKTLSQNAHIKLKLGHEQEALDLCDRALLTARNQSDSAAVQLFLANYHAGKGEYKEAYFLYRKAQGTNIMNENELITHSNTAKVTEYFQDQNNQNKDKAETANQKAAIYALLFVIAVILLIVAKRNHHNNMQQKKTQLDVLMSDMQTLRRQIEQISNKNALDTSKKFRFPSNILNSICEVCYKIMPGEEGFIKLGIHSAKCVETLASDEAFADLECYVNYCYDNLMAHFREQLPPLPDSHYRIAVLTFAGFSIVSIGQITKLKDGSLRNIRTNIRSAIKKSECMERELFLSYFPNLK